MRKLLFLMIMTVFIGMGAIPLRADDTTLFTANVAPDALIMFDLSGSMGANPGGDWNYQINPSGCDDCDCTDEYVYPTYSASHPYKCVGYTRNYIYGDSACNGPYYYSQSGSHTKDCSKLAIAKRAIFDLLDANDNGQLTTADEDLLNVRFGYMRFYGVMREDSTIDYNSGYNTLLRPFGFEYKKLFENYINPEVNWGWTSLATELKEGKKYLDDHKASDPAKECRKKFLILVTDGWDTVACGGDGTIGDEYVTRSFGYKRRKATLAAVKAAVDAGYQVFAVGFGADMPLTERNTMNWIAFKGGTDNYTDANSGDTSAITFDLDPCFEYVSCSPDQANCTNAPNDPGFKNLNGYAFLAQDATTLGKSLQQIIRYIKEKAFSFTAPTVPSVRLTDGQRVYISSFAPNTTPFWRGDVKAYTLNADGTLPVDGHGIPTGTPVWEAQKILETTSPDTRKIYTYKSGSLVNFTYANLANGDLGVSTNGERDALVKHVRGYDAWDIDQDTNTTESRKYKLGDIFHSQAVIVGSPSIYFFDAGYSGSGGFYDTKKNRTKVIITGANDGMIHAFDAATGAERWAFIPPDLLTSLKTMKERWESYKASGSSGEHLYYVDTSPRVSDVWFYSSAADTTKTADEWRTMLIAGLRKGGKTYFALDITDTTNPSFLWQFPKPGDTTTLNKMGQSWSEPNIARIKINVGGSVSERWVAFIGGGWMADGDAPQGRYLFVVDIKTGDIIKEFSGFLAPVAAPPLAVDTTSDTYVDRVYVGDEEGMMYAMYISDADPTNWTMAQLLKAPGFESGKHPFYYPPTVAFDSTGTPWVYFGSGDRENPTENSTERFYAIKDNDQGPYPREIPDLVDVSSNPGDFTPVPSNKYGWTIKLRASQKEKVLSKPVVYNQLVYFTTYSPNETDSDVCTVGGTARLYVAEYQSGGGALYVDDIADLEGSTTDRWKVIGPGVPSSPIITMDASGKATIIVGTTEGQVYSQGILSPEKNKHILYWREVLD